MSTHELTRPTVGEQPDGPADQPTDTNTATKPGARGGSSHLFGRGLLYVVVWSLQIVAGVVVSPILAHVLGPEQFGRLASVIALHQVLTVVALLGLDQALVLQRAADGNDRSARGLVAVGIVISLLVTGVVFVTGPLWSDTLGFDGFSTLVVAAILWTGAPGLASQFGLSFGPGESPLRLRDNPIERRELENGSELFAVSGQITNPSSEKQRVPDIRAELRDAQGRIVYSWTINPQQRTLNPGASIDFNSAKLDVPSNSKRLELSFAGEAANP